METAMACTCDDCPVHDGTGECSCDDNCTCEQCHAADDDSSDDEVEE